jgi:aminopeptidase N
MASTLIPPLFAISHGLFPSLSLPKRKGQLRHTNLATLPENVKPSLDYCGSPLFSLSFRMHRAVPTILSLLLLSHAGLAQPTWSEPDAGQRSCSAKAQFLTAHQRNAPAAYADPSIDVTYYRLNLRMSATPSYLIGSVLVKAFCSVDSLRSLGLDLMDVMRVDSVRAGGTTVAFTQFSTLIQISLDRIYRNGELISVEVFYQGRPVPTGFGSFEFGQHAGTSWIWSLSEPYGARDWWPCKDHPADKADSIDLFITCDAAFKVGSNGRLAEIIDNGNGTHTTHWSVRLPIATYLVSVAITNYAEFTNWFRYTSTDSMMVLNYVLPEHLTDALSQLPKVVPMLSIFSQAYGLYPFVTEKYGHAEFGSGGAMEHQTMTSTTSFDEDVISHELAHQWFGDLITCRTWPHLWLNEGFASYSEAVYRERMYGQSSYWSSISARMDLALQAMGTLYVQDTSTVTTLFDNRLVYSKGASVLHMLRHIVGDSVFFNVLRAYVNDPSVRFKTATTEDFQRVCEQISGRSLSYFFREWIYGENYPRYACRWTTRSGSPLNEVTVHIEQVTNTSNPQFFIMPVDLRLSNGSWDTTVVVFNSAASEDFIINTAQLPDTIVLDPGHWILRDILPQSEVLPTLFVLEQNFPNPFNRGTVIRYEVPRRRAITLKVFNMLGEDVATLVDGISEPGTYSVRWNSTGADGTRLPSGVYLYRLTSEGYAETHKLLLLR